jgi:hypothetical protein
MAAASAVFHASPRILLAAVKFFLGQDEASEDSDNDDDGQEVKTANPTKAEIYNASKKVRSVCHVTRSSDICLVCRTYLSRCLPMHRVQCPARRRRWRS